MATVGGRIDQLGPAPRNVPLPLAVGVYFGGAGMQVACVMLAIALLPIWYVWRHDMSPTDVFAFFQPTITVQGEVIEIIDGKTRSSGYIGTDGNGYDHYLEQVEVDGVRYAYYGPDGKRYAGAAYGIYQYSNEEKYANVGASIPVEYVVKDPATSRVLNLKRDPTDTKLIVEWAFWVALVVAGLCVPVILLGLLRGRRALSVLSNGCATYATLVDVASTASSGLTGRRNLTYRLTADGQTYDFKVRSSRQDMELTRKRDPVFYDAQDPARALAVAELPGHLEVDDEGYLTEGEYNPYHFLWMPALCTVGYIWLAACYFGIWEPPF